MEKVKDYFDFVEGEVFASNYEIAVREVFLEAGYTNTMIEKFWKKLSHMRKTPQNFGMFIKDFMLQDDLGNSIENYKAHFGLYDLSSGLIYLENLKNIYEKMDTRMLHLYKEYEERGSI